MEKEQRKLSTLDDYRRRINAITEYINSHLEEKIHLKDLAEISNFSPYHFHRITRAFFGEPIGAYISRMRVEAAAKLLCYSDLPVSEIAWRVGFEMQSSLAKAFHRVYGISPSDYRADRETTFRKIFTFDKGILLEKRIGYVRDFNVIYLHCRGDYDKFEYFRMFKKLKAFAKQKNLDTSVCEYGNILFDIPGITEKRKLRSDIFMKVKGKPAPSGEIGSRTVRGGKFVVFGYKGSYSNLVSANGNIFGKILPESGLKFSTDFWMIDYVSAPKYTLSENAKADIYVPID